MFAPVKKSPERLRNIERLEEWTRERFRLPEEATVSVSEIACPLRAARRLKPWWRSGLRNSATSSSCSSRWRRWSSTIFPLLAQGRARGAQGVGGIAAEPLRR